MGAILKASSGSLHNSINRLVFEFETQHICFQVEIELL